MDYNYNNIAASSFFAKLVAHLSLFCHTLQLQYSFQVPDDPNVPYDMLEVVKKVVDEGVVTEIMPNYAKNIICGFARMEGRTVGVSY